MNRTLFFNHSELTIAEVSSISSRGSSLHTIGGSLTEFGYKQQGTSGKVNLLYRLDQEDPLVPNAVPHCRWLPLIYAFYCCEYSSGEWLTAYRVETETTIRLLSPKKPWSNKLSFYSDYPADFPIQRVTLKKKTFDPQKIDDALRFSSVFGLQSLTPQDKNKALAKVRPQHKKRFDHGETDLDLEEFLANYSEPFMQGIPNDNCVFKKCPHYGKNQMKPLATIEGHPSPKHPFWSLTDDEPMVMLVFRQCTGCGTIHATPQAG